MQVSGSSIARVFTQPVAPPRKFRGVIDTALTLALGSVCAFALTLGPAPLNTVAASSAAAASFAGHFDPAQETALLPAEVGDSNDTDETQAEEESRPTPTPTPSVSTTNEPVAQSPVGSASPTAPGAARKAEKAAHPQPHAPKVAAPPQGVTESAALTIVETFRFASGLSAFVSADACIQPTVHANVTVTPNGVLPSGQAKQSLAPDPAHATVGTGPGALSVTIYACE